MRGGELSDRVRKSVVWEDVESAFEGRLKTGIIVNLEHLDNQDFLANAETKFLGEIQKVLRRENAVRVSTTLEGEHSIVKNDEEVLELKTFNTANKPILQLIDVTRWFIDNVQEPLLRKSSEFKERDSGWTLRSIVSLTVNINKCNHMRGSSYIELPASIHKNVLASMFKTLMMIIASKVPYFPHYIRSKKGTKTRVDCQITNNMKMS